MAYLGSDFASATNSAKVFAGDSAGTAKPKLHHSTWEIGVRSLTGSYPTSRNTCGNKVTIASGATSKVWPLEAFSACTAMRVDAPGRFSTTIGWPRLTAIFSPTIRAPISTAPPGGSPTRILIGPF